MRRLSWLFTPAFMLPFALAFVAPTAAIQSLERDFQSDRTIPVNSPIGILQSHAVFTRYKVSSPANQDTASLSGNWILLPVLASDTSTQGIPSLHFDLTTAHFSGFTGCNRMNGSFRIQGDQLTFSPDITLAHTICQGYNEKQFIVNLLRVTRFRITKGVLELRIDNMPVSKWVRKLPPEPLEKTI